MDDPEIDELCKTIYKNHRRAIDLIIERVGPSSAATISAIAEEVSKIPEWKIILSTTHLLRLMPCSWQNMLPPVGRLRVIPQDSWVLVTFRVTSKQCSNYITVAPANDQSLRREVIQRLIVDPKEFGLKSLFKNVEHIGDNWATLGRLNIDHWDPDEGPDVERLLPKVREVLKKRAKELAGVPAALSPIIESWEKRRRMP